MLAWPDFNFVRLKQNKKAREQFRSFWHRLILAYLPVAITFQHVTIESICFAGAVTLLLMLIVCVLFSCLHFFYSLIHHYYNYCCCCWSPFIWHCCLLERRNVNNSKCHFQSTACAYTPMVVLFVHTQKCFSSLRL